MTVRGALAGLALAALGAGCVAADEDALLSLNEDCLGNTVLSLEAVRTEFPDFMPNTVRAMLLAARNAHANSDLLLLRYESPWDLVKNNCEMADSFGLALEMLRSGDPWEIDQVRRGWMGLSE